MTKEEREVGSLSALQEKVKGWISGGYGVFVCGVAGCGFRVALFCSPGLLWKLLADYLSTYPGRFIIDRCDAY